MERRGIALEKQRRALDGLATWRTRARDRFKRIVELRRIFALAFPRTLSSGTQL